MRYIAAILVGFLVPRRLRFSILTCLTLCAWFAAHSVAQVPSQLQQQLSTFESMTPAQQQALISQLPPSARDQLINSLMGQQQQTNRNADRESEDSDRDFRAAQPGDSLSEEMEPEARLGSGSTLIIEFAVRSTVSDAQDGTASLAVDVSLERQELLERLQDANPYTLDGTGRLLLPGVAAIELAGLNEEQATVRLRAERSLRPFEIELTLLPLEPVGTSALEPFGYDIFRDSSSEFAPFNDIPAPADYIIGPGDSLNVQIFGNRNQNLFLTVSREGTINVPEIGPLTVAGLSFEEVRNLISTRVGEPLLSQTSTTLGELRSISVYVLGDVERPGSFEVSSLSTMTNALFASGGVKETGSLRRIALMRDGEAVTTLDLYDLILRGDISDDMRLQSRDVIYVPSRGETASITGEILRPAIYELNGEQSVGELVELAGGLLASADPGDTRLERMVPGRGITIVDLDLSGSLGRASAVSDGDVIRVSRNLDQLENSVRLTGNVQREGLYQWQEGMTLSDLLPGPELVRPLSDLNYVLIRREPQPNVDVEVLSVDIEAVWEQQPGAADLLLMPRDTVYVFNVESGRQQFIGPLISELEAEASAGQAQPVVRIGGQVRAEGEYPLEPGMRVSDLVRAGGGLSDASYMADAELRRYEIVEGEFRETALISVNLLAALNGDPAANLPLSAYDFLNVKQISRWGDNEEVTLIGEFVFPASYPIRRGERLSSVIERAGGLTEFASVQASVFTRVDLQEQQIERMRTLARRIEADLAALELSDSNADSLSAGRSLLDQLHNSEATGRLVIRLEDIMAGNIEADIILQDGDQLIVPETQQEVMVIGEVQYPTSHAFSALLTRDDYIQRSGGLTRRADKQRIYIVRANGEVVIDAGVRWFRRDAGIEIRPGDTVVAPMDVERIRPLTLWSSVTQIIYNLAVAAAAVSSF